MSRLATRNVTEAGYNNYFLGLEDLRHLPPYLKDVPETPSEMTCETKGRWPTWLKGSLVRIGAGKWVIPISEDSSEPPAILQHFFDGLGLLHKFTFENGQVRYVSRYTAEGVIRRAKKDGYLSCTMFGLNANTAMKDAQDPCSALLGAQQCMWVPNGHLEPDAANINVVPRRGMHLPEDKNPYSRGTASKKPEEEEIMINTDFNMLQILDATTLEPKRLLTYADIDPELAGFGICAHPVKDRKLGHQYNYLISKEGVMHIFSLDFKANPANLEWKTAIPCPPCYIHSLAMTQDYVVFVRNPIHMDTSDMTKPVAEMMEYEAGETTKFFVLRKSDGKHVATYETPSFMFFHTVNAYDFIHKATGETNIYIDICSYEGGTVPQREYYLSNILEPAKPFKDGTLVRYELTAINAKASEAEAIKIRRATAAQAIPGIAMELPRIRKDMTTVPGYRYVYAVSGNGGTSPGTEVPIGRYGNGVKVVQAAFFGSIAKTDWLTGTFLRWQPEDGESCPCEPVFVERPGSSSEDDGVVLTIVIDKKGTKSILIALDGKTLKEIARADMPQVYALGPHGSFIEG